MYFTLLFLVIRPLALYFIKYNLNYLSVYPIRNSPTYATWSATIGNFTPLCLIFSFIQVKNSLNLTFLLLNFLTNSIFTLDIPILVIIFSNTCPLLVNQLIIYCNWPIVTTYKSILAILILPTNFKAVAVIGVTFNSILINLMFPFYYN